MTAPYAFHVLIDPPAAGTWNMAVDEALLAHVVGEGVGVWLRFYQWQQPTLSLGYFQPFAPWRNQVRGDCRVVRRQTGGGAILHDRELTYSLTLPPRHPLTRSVEGLYDCVHRALIAALGRYGIEAELSGPGERPSGEEPYLCFLRRASMDVVLRPPRGVAESTGIARAEVSSGLLSNFKICGSAQRRRGGALLMHGSLLLSRSPLAPQIPGIEELTGTVLSPDDAVGAWREELALCLGKNHSAASALPDGVRQAARRIEREKFARSDWTARR